MRRIEAVRQFGATDQQQLERALSLRCKRSNALQLQKMLIREALGVVDERHRHAACGRDIGERVHEPLGERERHRPGLGRSAAEQRE